jgi:hypothetical protein
MDDDDQFVSGVGARVIGELNAHASAPVVFFRCVDLDGHLVGKRRGGQQTLDVRAWLETSFGELAVAVNMRLTSKPLFKHINRGFEQIEYAAIIRKFGNAVLSDVQSRIYDTSGEDRLSNNRFARANMLALGNMFLYREFGDQLSLGTRMTLLAKAIFYSVAAFIKLSKKSPKKTT